MGFPYRALNSTERARIRVALLNTADVRIGVELWDPSDANDHQRVSLTNGPIFVLAGEVQMDTDSDVSRSCSVTLADDVGKIRWGRRSGSDYALYPGAMIRVNYEVFDRTLAAWVTIPVFTGFVQSFEREGVEVTINALGKESMAMEPRVLWNARTFPKGSPYIQMIRKLMGEMGETRFDLPPKSAWDHKSHRRITIHRGVSVWPLVKRFATQAGNRVVYYRANGTLVVRPKRVGRPIWVFNDPRRPKHVLEHPRFTWDFTDLRNAAQVRYVQGDRNPAVNRVLLRQHHFSPSKLAINGEPLFLAEFDDVGGGKPKANEMLKRLLDNGMDEPASVSFESIGLPWLEEHSRAQLVWEGERYNFPVKSWSLGLGADGTLSVNVATDQLNRTKRGKK